MARQFAVVGLAVMGQNLALNIERNGFPVAVYNRTHSRTRDFLEGPAAGRDVKGAQTLAELVSALERPRRVLLMVKAGPAVDAVLGELLPLVEPGDIVIDGGNSHFRDTERRMAESEASGVHFVGMGVSGGEEGALKGPSLMPGGDRVAYEILEPTLTAIAAKTDSGPCVTYLGPGGAGHFVKMVHNGIEYGDMQLIAEAYDLLRQRTGLDAARLREVFAEWNRGELESFLVEITAEIVDFPDEGGGGILVDRILDSAGQKGTGRWTTEAALELGVPIPTITAAVDARLISALKEERVAASRRYESAETSPRGEPPVDAVRAALYGAKICSYAQGFALLAAASREHGFGLALPEVARIWKGGCIIRAALLDEIREAFGSDPGLANLLVSDGFRDAIAARDEAWRRVVSLGAASGVPLPAMTASLAYLDAYRRERLPASLIQAQRDYFGAHTYRRTDREGTFHTEWKD
jgi:6-phosphogluconate dehydrogenase